jgi:hypothetical protein
MSLRQRYKSVSTPVWFVFLLPGQLLPLSEYYYPKRGEVWASARRVSKRFVHVLGSIAFWPLAFIMVCSFF